MNIPEWMAKASLYVILYTGFAIWMIILLAFWAWAFDRLCRHIGIASEFVQFVYDRHRKRKRESETKTNG